MYKHKITATKFFISIVHLLTVTQFFKALLNFIILFFQSYYKAVTTPHCRGYVLHKFYFIIYISSTFLKNN